MARPQRSMLPHANRPRRSLPVQLTFPGMDPNYSVNGYITPNHWVPFDPTMAPVPPFAPSPRPPQNQAHISTSIAHPALVNPFTPPTALVPPQYFDAAINNCNQHIQKWVIERTYWEHLRARPLPQSLVRVANTGPHAHQLRQPSGHPADICPPAPRLNGNLPLPDVGEVDIHPNKSQAAAGADSIQTHIADRSSRPSSGKLVSVEELHLRPTTVDSVLASIGASDAVATSTTAVHAAARQEGGSTPLLRTISGEDVVVVDGLMELRRSRSASASATVQDGTAASQSPTASRNKAASGLTIQTSGLGLIIPDDGDVSDAPTPGLAYSPSVPNGSLSQSSTASSLPSVLGPPVHYATGPQKPSPAHHPRSQSTPQSHMPLVADPSDNNRFSFRTDLPLNFDTFPPDGYAVVHGDGEPIGWSAGPASTVQSLASCIRRGDAAPIGLKEKNKRVTFEESAENEASEQNMINESSNSNEKTPPKRKEKTKKAKSSPSTTLLSPRRAMKAAKRAKAETGEA